MRTNARNPFSAIVITMKVSNDSFRYIVEPGNVSWRFVAPRDTFSMP